MANYDDFDIDLDDALSIATNQDTKDDKLKEGDTITHKGLEYKVIKSPHTGRLWLDRNLGAKRVAQSMDDELAYGDYFMSWKKTNDIENLYPKGCKMPSEEEWLSEIRGGVISDQRDAYNSYLKLPSAGAKDSIDSAVMDQTAMGVYWSSSFENESPYAMYFDDGNLDIINGFERDTCASVRCIVN